MRTNKIFKAAKVMMFSVCLGSLMTVCVSALDHAFGTCIIHSRVHASACGGHEKVEQD